MLRSSNQSITIHRDEIILDQSFFFNLKKERLFSIQTDQRFKFRILNILHAVESSLQIDALANVFRKGFSYFFSKPLESEELEKSINLKKLVTYKLLETYIETDAFG